jgi:acetoin utilization protein AcuB
MSSPAVALPAETSLQDALRFMEGRRIRHVAVSLPTGSTGIVTTHDLHRSLALGEVYLGRGRRKLGDLLPEQPMSVHPDLPVERAVELMLLNGVTGLPVAEDGRLVGLVTASDIFRAFTYVMGVCESGARISVTALERDNLLESIQEKSVGLVIRSLIACPSPQGGLEVVMRVRGRKGVSAA